MTSLIESFPASFSKTFIGFERLLGELDGLASAANYPPYNLIREDEEHSILEIALAGFSPSDITVTTKNGNLVISGRSKNEDNQQRNYVYRGLATREFTRTWKLYDYIVTDASFENGILSVHLELKLPDHLKPQTFEIKTTKQLEK